MKKILMLLFVSNVVMAGGGFDKPSPYSAEAARKMAAIESSVEGSLATIYNPAGLVKGANTELSFDLSIMGGYQQGSLVKSHEQNKGDASATLVPGFTAKKNITENLSVGLGAVGLAGLNSIYHNNSFENWSSELAGYSPDVYSKLSIVEYSLGLGYRLTKNISVGGSFRGLDAKASFKQSTIALSSGLGGYGIADDTALYANSVEIKDLKGQKWGGQRFGLMIENDNKTMGIGFNYRSRMDVTTKGSANGEAVYTSTGSAYVNAATGVTPTAGQVYAMTSSGASVATTLPTQYSVAGHVDTSETTRVFAGYTLTKYSQVKQLTTNGTLTDTLTGNTIVIPNTILKWKDMHEYKMAIEHKLSNTLALSTGLGFSTAVSNKSYTSATNSPVGPVKHATVGLEKVFAYNSSHNVRVNLAAEYMWGSGTGSSNEVVDTTNGVRYPSVETKTILKNYNAFMGVSVDF